MIRPGAGGSMPISDTCRRVAFSMRLAGKCASNRGARNSASASARVASPIAMPSFVFTRSVHRVVPHRLRVAQELLALRGERVRGHAAERARTSRCSSTRARAGSVMSRSRWKRSRRIGASSLRHESRARLLDRVPLASGPAVLRDIDRHAAGMAPRVRRRRFTTALDLPRDLPLVERSQLARALRLRPASRAAAARRGAPRSPPRRSRTPRA